MESIYKAPKLKNTKIKTVRSDYEFFQEFLNGIKDSNMNLKLFYDNQASAKVYNGIDEHPKDVGGYVTNAYYTKILNELVL